eukprot:Pgem_evm1s6785
MTFVLNNDIAQQVLLMKVVQAQKEQEMRKQLHNHLIQSQLQQYNLDTERQQLAKSWPLTKFMLSFISVDSRPTSHIELCFALIYANSVLQKLEEQNKVFCHHCLLATCMLLASKYLDDGCMKLTKWASICNIPVKYMAQLEKEIVEALDYNLYISWSTFETFSASYTSDPYVQSFLHQRNESTPSSPIISSTTKKEFDFNAIMQPRMPETTAYDIECSLRQIQAQKQQQHLYLQQQQQAFLSQQRILIEQQRLQHYKQQRMYQQQPMYVSPVREQLQMRRLQKQRGQIQKSAKYFPGFQP